MKFLRGFLISEAVYERLLSMHHFDKYLKSRQMANILCDSVIISYQNPLL